MRRRSDTEEAAARLSGDRLAGSARDAELTAGWLADTKYVDASHPAIRALAAELRRDGMTDTVRVCFEHVRDRIAHSCDVETTAMPLVASEVLAAGTGLCFAKSHLLAALLRANGIPAALGYVRLRDTSSETGFCLHGYNVVQLIDHGLVRLDARGNNARVNTTFDPPRESLAYRPAVEGEGFLCGAYVDPLAKVIDAYARARTLRGLLARLPDEEV